MKKKHNSVFYHDSGSNFYSFDYSLMGRGEGSQAYVAVMVVIENALVIDARINHKGKGYNTIVIAAPIEIN